jgi:hypothetical protein
MNANRDVKMLFCLSNNERAVLKIMAVEEGRNLSEMLRTALREAADRRGYSHIGLINLPHKEQAAHNQEPSS